MRAREQRLVITFRTTAEAIAMEAQSKSDSIPGRLIPVPRQISAGCGLAWSMPTEWQKQMGEYLRVNQLKHEQMGIYLI